MSDHVYYVGYSADNANVNFGSEVGGIGIRDTTSVSKKNENVYSKLCLRLGRKIIKARCSAHICHNAARATVTALNSSVLGSTNIGGESRRNFDIDQLLHYVYSYFAVSASRINSYRIIAARHTGMQPQSDAVNEEIEDIQVKFADALKPVKTRWCSLRPAVDRLIRMWDAFVEYFENEVSAGEENKKLETIRRFIANTETGLRVQLVLHFVAAILPIFEWAENVFQAKESSILDTYPVLHLIHTQLIDIRKNGVELNQKAIDIFQRLSPNIQIEFQNLFDRALGKSIDYLAKWGELEGPRGYRELLYRAFRLVNPLAPNTVEIPVFENLKRIVQDIEMPNISLHALHEDCNRMQYMKTKLAALELISLPITERWLAVVKEIEIPEMQKVISYILSIPASFSLMNFRYRKERSVLKAQHLSNELFIQQNMQHISFQKFPEFISKKKALLAGVRSSEAYKSIYASAHEFNLNFTVDDENELRQG